MTSWDLCQKDAKSLSICVPVLSGASMMGFRAGTPLGHTLYLQAETSVGPQSSIKDGFNSTVVPRPSVPENQKCWMCVNEVGSETIAWTHADPLSPP